MIALFDSGYGGLTQLKAITSLLPEYDYIYLGDNARTPYGTRSKDVLIQFCREAVDFLFKRGATLIIFACNTASGEALQQIQKEYILDKGVTDRKILGVTAPLAEGAVEAAKGRKIGVVGTHATVNSKNFEREIMKIDSTVKIKSASCPLLVPLIEEGWHKKPETKSILKKYLRNLKSHNTEYLILGCTHYPIIQKDFERIMGKNCKVLDTGKIVAEKLKDYLTRHPEIESLLAKNRKRTFLTTNDPEMFMKLGSFFLEEKIDKVEKIHL